VSALPAAAGGVAPRERAARAQVVDPAVSREKFVAELDEFRRLEAEHRRRGWWLMEASFPTVFVVFAAPQLRPSAVVCGVELDFTNYDLEPPSVRLVDPFTREPYRAKDLPTTLPRRQDVDVSLGPAVQRISQAVPLMVAHDAQDVPFLCIPGVYEYHTHPAHTGDSWLLHRGKGAGRLFTILHTIYQYGVQPLTSYQVGLRVIGFVTGEPPL
jgi:hypothetical protein